MESGLLSNLVSRDRKCSKRHKVIAIKAVAHKLARAGYYLMRDGGTFDEKRAFG